MLFSNCLMREDDYNSKTIAELVKGKEIARKAKEPSIIANCNALD